MRYLSALLVLFVLAPLAACDDPNAFRIDPLLVSDTVELAAPSASSSLPSALDIVSVGGIIRGGRRPERVEDAEQFDLAIRMRSGQLVFAPVEALGLQGPQGSRSRAAVTRPLAQSFDELKEAPLRNSFITDSVVAIQQGAVYAVRSRLIGACTFGAGVQYAKIQPLEVVPSEGRVRLRIVTNERCDDPRLVEED